MKRVYVFVILLMCIITCRNLSSVFSQTVNYWHQDGKIYFKLKDNVALDYSCGDWGSMKLSDVEFLTPIINKYGLSSIKKSFYAADDRKLQRTYLLAFDEIGMVDELISELQELDIIEYAEPAPIFRPSLSVNDTYYNQTVTAMWVFSANTSWHLNVINAEQAWDISTGDTNIMVAVLDNAIWTDHPDLANKIAVEIDLGDSDSTASPPEATYIWSHGTHSAGLIGAETNNGLGVASIGYNVSLMAVKLGQDASDGQGMTAGFEGIVWAADNGADVISMSWGSPQYFQTMQNTINYAYNKGCVMLAAAGNNGNGMETQVNPDIPVNYVGYPAALEHVIAVGSSDAGDNKSDFSNYGTWIDVLSPGGFGNSMLFSVLSTTYSDAGDLTAALNGEGGGAASYGISGKYDVMQGTSMATPVAAGLAGLMLSVNPDLTPDELAAIMMASCDNVDAQNAAFVDSIGAGRINAAAALQAVLDSMTVITADFMANTVSILPGDAVNFTDLSTGNPTSWTWTFEGGTPAASTLQNPASIQYNDEGTFAVTLEVSDGTNSDIEIKTCFILVGGFLMPNSAWELQNSAFATQYRAILDLSIPNDSVAWGLSYDGTSGTITTDFTRTVNGGQTWTPGIITAANGLAPGNICAINDNVAWVAMYSTSGGGGIYKTSDAGVSWTHQASASFSDAGSFANLVHFFNSNEGFCMGDPVNGEFEIYTTSDGGDTWSLAPGANIPDPESGEMGWTGVYDAVGDTAWFGSNTGRVFRSTDKGSTWEVFSTGRANVSEISMNDALNGVALCAEYDQTTGQLLSWALIFTTDGGQTWQLVSEDLNNTKSDVAAVPGVPGMVVATKISQVTEENGSFYSYNYGGTWVQLDDSVQYTSVDFLSETVGWAGSFNLTESFGGIYKWIGVPMTVPYFVSAPVTSVIEDSLYTYLAHAVDPDSSILVMEATLLPAWLSFTDNGDNTALLTGIPDSADVGDHSVILIATNGTDTAFQSFTVTVITNNRPPEITSAPVTSVQCYVYYNYNVVAIDPDGDNLSFAAPVKPSWMSLLDNGDGTAVLYGTPLQPSVSYDGEPVTVEVTDGIWTVLQEFYVKVNFGNDDIPYFTTIPDTSVIPAQQYTYQAAGYDPDHHPLVFGAAALPSWLIFTDYGTDTALLAGAAPLSDTAQNAYFVALFLTDGFDTVSQEFYIDLVENSIYEVDNARLRIYPNPVSDRFIFEYVAPSSEAVSVRISNANGKVIFRKEERPAAGSFIRLHDVTEYPKGVYLFEIRCGKTLSVSRIVVE